jgi:hypothetical protein
MKALLYAENGNLDHLFDTENKIYHIIAENWIRSEKLMIRTDDSGTPPTPIKTLKKISNAILSGDSTIESIHENSATVNAQKLKYFLNKKQLLEGLKARLIQEDKPNKIVSLVSNIRNRSVQNTKSKRKCSKRKK